MPSRNLSVHVPILAGALLVLGGCYTMLSHPMVEITSGPDTGYGDCASCHSGFAEPVYTDPYAHYSDLWWDYYGCPWWVADCGAAAYPAGGSADEAAGGDLGAESGRFIGGRGGTVQGFRSLPPTAGPTSPSMVAPGAPAVNPGQQKASDGSAVRTKKKGKNEGADKGGTPSDPAKDKRDDPKDAPTDDPPPGGGL